MAKLFLKSLGSVAALGALFLVPSSVQAHHSFAIYDLDNAIEITGELKKFQFRNPHITLEVEAVDAEGNTRKWLVESMAPRRWDGEGVPRDPAKVGDIVTILGWPGVKGDPIMALGSVTTEEKGTTVVRDRIRQQDNDRGNRRR